MGKKSIIKSRSAFSLLTYIWRAKTSENITSNCYFYKPFFRKKGFCNSNMNGLYTDIQADSQLAKQKKPSLWKLGFKSRNNSSRVTRILT